MVELLLRRGERGLYALPTTLRDVDSCHISARYEEDWRLWLNLELQERSAQYVTTAAMRGPSAAKATLDGLALVSHALNGTFSFPNRLMPAGVVRPDAPAPYHPWKVDDVDDGWVARLQIPKAEVGEGSYRGTPAPFYRYAERLLHCAPVRGVVRLMVERS